MHVKTYTGTSITGLLTQIKEEIGSDAVILSTREFVQDNKTVHEVVVGMEEPISDTTYTKLQVRNNTASMLKETIHTAAVPTLAYTQEDGKSSFSLPMQKSTEHLGWKKKIERELSSIQEHICSLLLPSVRTEFLTDTQKDAFEHLVKEGLTEYASVLVYRKMVGNPTESVGSILSSLIALRPWNEESWRERLHCVVGVSGSGKSSTVLKMALSLQKSSPNTSVLLINLDSERTSGKFFLRHFAGLSKIAYQEAKNAKELQYIIQQSEAKKIVIDVPSLTKGDSLARYLRTMQLEEANVHVVLPASMSIREIDHILAMYSIEGKTSVMWTKLDEAFFFANIVNTAITKGIPLSAISFGKGLQNTFAPVSFDMLWNVIFTHTLPQ